MRGTSCRGSPELGQWRRTPPLQPPHVSFALRVAIATPWNAHVFALLLAWIRQLQRFNGILKTFPRARALRSDSRVKKPIDFIDFIEFVFISRWLFEIENRGETLNVNSSLMELVEANSSLSNRLYTNICFWLYWFFRVSVLFCCFVDVVKEIKRKRRRRRNGALTGVRKIGARERREEFLSRQR